MIIWLTGLPASGKTTIAQALQVRLSDYTSVQSFPVILDGDEVRKGLSADLGLSKDDRQEHVRRVVCVSKLLWENGITAIVSLISPYKSMRDLARKELDVCEDFIEVWVKCSLDECIRRDPKGLYVKALAGEIIMTGLQDPYEEPINPDVVVETEYNSVAACVDKIMAYIVK